MPGYLQSATLPTEQQDAAPSVASLALDYGSNAAQQAAIGQASDGSASSSLGGIAERVGELTGSLGGLLDWWGGGREGGEEEPDELRSLMAQERLAPEELARARALITALPEAQQAEQFLALQSKVVYENQRNNESDSESSSGGTCSVSSLSMALQYLGIPNPHPEMQYADALDRVRLERGLGDITSSDTWEAIALHLGAGMVTLAMGDATHPRGFWEGEVRDCLSSGMGVILSIAGHVVRLEGMDDRGLIVDDPFGASLLARPRNDGSGKEYAWDELNESEADGTAAGNVGEDWGYPWEDVEKHAFRSVLAFRNLG